MGLDTTHNCWSGSHTSFGIWRSFIWKLAGYGDLKTYLGFGGNISFNTRSYDPLTLLINHSDCEGILEWQQCNKIAERLESLIPLIMIRIGQTADIEERNDLYYNIRLTERFINGLRDAFHSHEDVEFY